jgi:hypothetical protein
MVACATFGAEANRSVSTLIMSTRTTSKAGRTTGSKANSTTAKQAAPRGKAVPAPRKPRNLAAQLPGEQHPGQTSAAGKLHDRPGSQPERERHQHPGSTNPKSGAARSNKRATKR